MPIAYYKLMVMPAIEVKLHGKSDVSEGSGSDLSGMELMRQRRHKIKHEFTLHIAVNWPMKYGGTAGLSA